MTETPARSHGEAATGTGRSRGDTAGTRRGHGDSPQGSLEGCSGRGSAGSAASHSILGGVRGFRSGEEIPKILISPLVGCGPLPALGRW